MSLAQRRQAVAQAETRLAEASQQLRRSWTDLQHEGQAALTPGRVVIAGLLAGVFGGAIMGRRTPSPADRPRQDGEGVALILDLLRIGGSLLPLLLPGLAPAFRAGVAAGSGGASKSHTDTETSASA
jgi:hypothetical protein